jgi:hypothetical protein
VIEAPDTVPDTVPRPVTVAFLSLSVIVNVRVPENDDPDCVTCHVMSPGPDESDAAPVQLPVMLAPGFGEDGGLGCVGDELADPLLHARLETRTQDVRSRIGIDVRT